MPFPLRILMKHRCITICFLGSMSFLVAFTSLSAMRNIGSLATGAKNRSPAQSQTPPPVKVITITVTPRGFNPSIITIPEGRYLIDINNRSGISDLKLQLGLLDARKLRESKPVKDAQGRELKSQDWRGLFTLLRGAYTITESSHPNWIVKLQVDESNR